MGALNMMSDQTLRTLQQAIIALVRHRPHLSGRQLGIFLIYYIENGPQSLASLAERLGTDKPAITRAIDRLCQLDLMHRKLTESGNRTLYVERTKKGNAFLQHLRFIMAEPKAVARVPLPQSADRMSARG